MQHISPIERVFVKFDVYGIGNALVDIQAHVSEELLAELKFAKGIMTLVEDETQQFVLSHLSDHHVSRCAGGSAANTIMGVADFGGKGAYAGKTADDAYGSFFVNDMRRKGIKIDVAPGIGQTGTCVILITDDAQRTMLTNLAVSSSLSPDDVDEKAIAQSKYVYIEGYLFGCEPNRSAALRAIEIARSAGVKVAFTVSDPFLIQYHREEFWSLIEGPVDLLFCNLEEARALTGRHDPIECAREIHRHAENVALTLGADGSLLMHEGAAIPIEGVKAKAVDTTGAGDMYAAGILYGITNGLTWKQAGRLASHAAGRIVSQLGARLQKPLTREEIQTLVD
jgi:sugar/nucleoside kinase (ribokinase family)